MKIKMHKGSLAESMMTAAEIEPNVEAVSAYLIRQGVRQADVAPGQVKSVPYGKDDRIGWDVHLVMIEGAGVIAATDGPFESK
ncbi:hypothetical protein SRABI89_05085 [Pseudomonas koreensis]|nr:hypothetical protein SRABI89_05085 [Pseudomonas koreensis]